MQTWSLVLVSSGGIRMGLGPSEESRATPIGQQSGQASSFMCVSGTRKTTCTEGSYKNLRRRNSFNHHFIGPQNVRSFCLCGLLSPYLCLFSILWWRGLRRWQAPGCNNKTRGLHGDKFEGLRSNLPPCTLEVEGWL